MNILFIDACISNHKPSRTKYLCEKYLDGCLKRGDTVTRLDLIGGTIRPLMAEDIAKRDQLLSEGKLDDPMFDAAKQLRDAERIVIGAPFWDLSFPAVLKDYIENIMVTGITFKYNEHGMPVGLCRADKIVYIMTAGGPVHGFNFGYDYVKGIMTMMLGVKEAELYCAENLDVFGADVDSALADVCSRMSY